MRTEFLNFSPPLIGEEEIMEVVDTLRSGWITTGPKTKAFEEDFSRHLGAPAALALSSCTAGLHTALVACGIGAGDEVITTPMTFASTVNVVEQVGARPVLADVVPDTLNIDPYALARCVTKRTKALIPVHFAGHPVDLDGIRKVTDGTDIEIIEDAAHAFTARYKGAFIGSGANPVAFSFYATKNLTTGEGGMLTGSADFIDRARVISLHGMSRDAWMRYGENGSWFYEVVMPGFKYNMTDIQAAIGLWQLRKIEGFQTRRRAIAAAYQEAFRGIEALDLPVARPEVEHAWHLYLLRLVPEVLRIGRDRFIEELRNRKIGTSVHFIPIHVHPYYRDKYGYAPEDFPVAWENYLRSLSLPLNPAMMERDIFDVIEAVVDITRQFKR